LAEAISAFDGDGDGHARVSVAWDLATIGAYQAPRINVAGRLSDGLANYGARVAG
jgi:hypothetical protein